MTTDIEKSSSSSSLPLVRDEKMRVKLYMLNSGRTWDDQGTGYVSSTLTEKTKSLFLLVKEENKNTVLLESKVLMNTAYQKQQETLIVWSEADNFDYALSFQNKAGCDEVWSQICQVQGKDPSVEITQDVMTDDDDEDDNFDVTSTTGCDLQNSMCGGTLGTTPTLPICEMSKLDDIAQVFRQALASPIRRERLALAVETEGYISKLVEVFKKCEDLEITDCLHKLHNIFKDMFYLNKTSILELLFGDDVMMYVIGALEYDPGSMTPAKHRHFLLKEAKLRQVVPLVGRADLIRKIEQTFRVQYIQEVILPAPSVFEENSLSTLASFVYFNKMEIVSSLQDDDKFLKSLFRLLTDDETDDQVRKDAASFLKEFCSFSQTLAQQNRDAFFRTLSSLGILSALATLLASDIADMRTLAIDIFAFVAEFSPSLVREYCLQEARDNADEDLLINLIIEQMKSDSDPELGGALQLAGIIKTLIDPDNMIASTKAEKSDFLSFFYPHCMPVLTAQLFANTSTDKPAKDDYQTAQLLSHIVELVTFCVEHHSYHAKTYIINKMVLKRTLVLLKSKHAFLQLAALRLLRRTIGLRDEFYNRHIVKTDLLKMVGDAYIHNDKRYNLLDSAIIELFEFIKSEDVKTLTNNLVEKHFTPFENVTYVQTFKLLKQRYDQRLEKSQTPNADYLSNMVSMTSGGRGRGRVTSDDDVTAEENWFDEEDDADDDSVTNTTPWLTSDAGSESTTNFDLIRNQNREVISPILNNRQSSFLLGMGRGSRGHITINLPNKDSSESKAKAVEQAEISTCTDAKQSGQVAVNAKTPGLLGLVEYADEEDDEDESCQDNLTRSREDGDSAHKDDVVSSDSEQQHQQQTDAHLNIDDDRESDDTSVPDDDVVKNKYDDDVTNKYNDGITLSRDPLNFEMNTVGSTLANDEISTDCFKHLPEGELASKLADRSTIVGTSKKTFHHEIDELSRHGDATAAEKQLDDLTVDDDDDDRERSFLGNPAKRLKME